MIAINGTIQIQDKQGTAHNIDGDDFNIEDPEVDERAQGPEQLYEATFEDDTAGFTITVQISEYPVGAYNHHDIEIDGGTLLEDHLEIIVEPD